MVPARTDHAARSHPSPPDTPRPTQELSTDFPHRPTATFTARPRSAPLVKDDPTGREYRRFKLSQQVVAKLVAHIKAQSLGRDDHLFSITRDELPRPALLKAASDPDDLGFTEPNEKGRTYRRGTMSAYNAGKCHCDHCRAASAR